MRALLLSCSVFILQQVLLAAELHAWEGMVHTVRSPEGSKPVRAVQDTDGGIALVVDSEKGPLCFQSNDYGRTFSKPIRLIDDAALKPGLEFHVWDAALGTNGRLFVALGTNAWKLNLPKEEWGCYLATIDLNQGEFLSLRNINRKPSEGFSIAVNRRGDVAVCWLADKLYANFSWDKGKTFGESIAIDSSINPCNCCTTASVFLDDLKLAVLYREETDNRRDMYLATIDSKTLETNKQRISKTPWKIDTCPMTYFSLTQTADGLTAAWPTERTVYFGRMTDKGVLLPPGEIKTDGLSGMRTGITTLHNAKDHTLLIWNSDNRIGWQEMDGLSKLTSQSGSIETNGKGVAGFLDRDGNYVLVH